MKSLNLFKNKIAEAELNFTSDLSNAIYLLPDGSMIDGEFDYGCRNEDHRCIFSAVEYGDYYTSSNPGKSHWDRIHKEYKVIRLVPETNIALIKKYQRLTPDQETILSSSSYEIEKY